MPEENLVPLSTDNQGESKPEEKKHKIVQPWAIEHVSIVVTDWPPT